MWNRIPVSIREGTKLNVFKIELCKYLWTQIDRCDHPDDDDDDGQGSGSRESRMVVT